jgi:aminoglycoside 3-N-acetyltransferase
MDYSKNDIVGALKAVGIKDGDAIFNYSNIGFFGRLEGDLQPLDFYVLFKEAIFNVLGESGTFIVPTFSYSFCWGKVFDKNKTPSTCGFLSEMILCDEASLRSEDANFSVAALGADASYLTSNANTYSFGDDSFWARFLKRQGKFCNFNLDAGSAFFHYVERLLKVPYRYDKAFAGQSLIDGQLRSRTFYHFCRRLDDSYSAPDSSKFDRKAKELGLAKVANLGRGQVVAIAAQDAFDLIQTEYRKNQDFLIKGG